MRSRTTRRGAGCSPTRDGGAPLLPWLFRVGFEVTAADVWTTPGRRRRRPLAAARTARSALGAALLALRRDAASPARGDRGSSPTAAPSRACAPARPAGPHWYLAGIGVDPPEQRKGIGSALLGPGLEGAAREGLPCVLLTNAERNLPFYRRHGFEVVLEGETPVGGPHAWAMVHKP